MQVPPNVYYDANGGNFYHQLTRAGMGAAFWKEWSPFIGFFPVTPIGDKVKRCKYCAEPALPNGRQECAARRKRRLTKAKEAEAFRASLPLCATEGCKLPATYRHNNEGGIDITSQFCTRCKYDMETAEQERQQQLTKRQQLDAANTVEALQEWIRKYVL